MVERWETGGCSSSPKDGPSYHQHIPNHWQTAHLQPEALPLAEGKVMRWGRSVSLETGSPASVQREAHGLYNWGKDLALEIPSARGGVCVRERENTNVALVMA